MKVNKRTQSGRAQKISAFTLIEMIGVLAVIAILAALLIPKVFTAISNARVNNAAVSCETVRAALADHYSKFGSIPIDGTVPTAPVNLTPGTGQCLQYDGVLLREGFLDKPFMVKIGDGIQGPANTRVEVINISTLHLGDTVDTGENSGYALSGGATNTVVGSALVQAVITGVTEADALDLSQKIDGIQMSSQGIGFSDTSGKVKYATSSSNTVVYVYLNHR